MSTRALFLDRDGVINVNHGYVHKPEEMDFLPGIFALCRAAVQRGYRLIVVTNQAGIGRGYYTEADFAAVTAWMREQFKAEGAEITAVYHCPHHPEHGVGEYRRESDWRKPGPGMLLAAAQEHGLHLPDCVMVGDMESDVEAGLNAGVGRVIRFAEQGAADSRAHRVVRSLEQCIEVL